MDFYKIKTRSVKNGVLEIYPDFQVTRSKDIMIRGKSFYAIWDEESGLWSTDEYDVRRIVDDDLNTYFKDMKKKTVDRIEVKWMRDFNSGSWTKFKKFVTQIQDNSHPLDEKVTFRTSQTKKTDYASKRLSYDLEKGECPNYDKLVSTLYDRDERAKIEWGIGAVLNGDAKKIQKFLVFYGEAGTGKSTMLNIIERLFEEYVSTFDAKSLGAGSGNVFATEVFRTNPLVAIQHDGDLSRIEDNTRINSIVAHESIIINEKYKSGYPMKINAMLFMGTNKPVKITDSKSGIIRRLIDVHPTGNRFSPKEYNELMDRIPFEIGNIAKHCLDVYLSMGPNYYNAYKPFEMIEKTDVFFNFVSDNYELFEEQDGCSLSQAWDVYKTYCEETALEYKLPRYKFKEELKNYFLDFHDRYRIGDLSYRSYYTGFLKEKFEQGCLGGTKEEPSLVLDSSKSIFDEIYKDQPAQYAKEDGSPSMPWDKVKTKLCDLDTGKLHYVLVPKNHIVIDFDLKDEKGDKSYERNMERASHWPSTYSELSKSGNGIHLHYIYDGDVDQLSLIYDENIEIKVYRGKSALRRKVTRCNRLPISHISSGLPLKGAKKVIDFDGIKDEMMIRKMIIKNLKKEYHADTRSSIDFINKILGDAYRDGIVYDVSDLMPKVMAFANNSTNQAKYCVKLVAKMPFKSETRLEVKNGLTRSDEPPIVFFDVEVFPNLLLINWKYADDKLSEYVCTRMINPRPQDVGELFKYRLIGFNNLRYDNHILYARYIGKSIEEVYKISQKIINDNGRNSLFSEAYGLSYTDVYDFASAGNKKSLKKFEIELGIHHMELGLPWDQPVPEELWLKVAEYCDNDVFATEKVFHHLKADWVARQILADIAEMPVNTTTNQLTAEIIFGDCPNPSDYFNYRFLGDPVKEMSVEQYNFLHKRYPYMMKYWSKDPYGNDSMLPYFPGYKFENGVSTYKGIVASEGGLVITNPGIWWNVGLLDIESMHPTSELLEYLFERFTESLADLVDGRLGIKHADYEILNHLFDGKLMKYVEQVRSGEITWKDLAGGLKTAINAVYGLTAASFPNPFRNSKNVDNIVAKRGALFMIDLKEAVESKGWIVAHIKTDSIKIPDITPEKIDFVKEFGLRYGYTFDHEDTYNRMCLVNKACYICVNGKGEWSATASQFAHPYVFKTLFSKEPLEFKDYCETKSVKTAIYLDMNESLSEGEHDYRFVGKVGSFVPIKEGCGGGELMRLSNNDSYHSVTGTKGYRWMEAEQVVELGKEKDVDLTYFQSLATEAIETIEQYGNFNNFVEGVREDFMNPPWDEELPFE